ncbi:flippase [uncultured Duncaniella sp.]|uniref:flippase n=1 Tax=uncultured Duncaniella sp. TaxID=2768039 RepID=UPI002675A3FF|nr:flippase [uncultured Duncaniella sp.]
MPSIKGNIILNAINTITGILFPVITFPYAARVLMPDGIGAVNFLNSIITYIVLLTSIGIPMYAVKEVAKYRDDKIKRDKITVEIIILSTFLCLLGYVAVWLLAEFIPQIHQQATLFYVLSLTIVFTAIGVNWFYQGIEDFKFITIRAIIIRTFAAAALFIFVKDQSDLLIYGIIIVGSTVGNNFINFVHLRKHIRLNAIRFKDLKIARHLKPSLQVFILNLIISLYIQLNTIMLGFLSGDDAVGYFTAGTKISHIGLTIIGSLGTVLLPRCSHLIKIGDNKGFESVIKKSLNLTLALSLPMTAGLMMLAVPITMVFCGSEYIESIPVLYLNAPVVVLISLTNLMGIQVLYPLDKIKIVIESVGGGAFVNLILNFIFIPRYGAIGAAISTLCAETAVLIIQVIKGKRIFPFKISDILSIKYITATLIMSMAVYSVTKLDLSYIMMLCTAIFTSVVVYGASLILMKDDIVAEFCTVLVKTLKR